MCCINSLKLKRKTRFGSRLNVHVCSRWFYRHLLIVLMVTGWSFLSYAQDGPEEVYFEIRGFIVEGNTVLDEQIIYNTLAKHTGIRKTTDDVESARDELEKLYHIQGYPTVLVNIPEQTVGEGLLRFEVIESRIRRVRVTGNRYFTMEKIKKDLPGLRPGEIIYLNRVKQELSRINRNPDIKISPVLMPGRKLGTIDVELKVTDRLPLHGSLEINNRASHTTTDLRFIGMLSYDNLWQKEHSLSFQYQTSPKDTDEVRALSVSYLLPAPWNRDQILALYGIKSDSNTAFGDGFEVIGTGRIYGARLVVPLPGAGVYAHNLTIGMDYKDFDETLEFGTQLRTPITYIPLSLTYGASRPDSTGVTSLNAALNLSFRNLLSDPREFEIKRFNSRGNYIYAVAGVERTQLLPWKWSLFLKINGQVADQPLISNEQYLAGGMDSVRGYKESEAAGDNALHTTLELIGIDLADYLTPWKQLDLIPFAFYDMAALRTLDPLPGQEGHQTIEGAGIGLRGKGGGHLEYALNWAVALDTTDSTDSGTQRFYFRVKTKF